MKLAHSSEKHFLDQVINLARRHASEQDTVDHASVAIIEAPERGSIAGAGGADDGVIVLRYGARPDSHSLTFPASSPKVNAVSHD
jgi:hypothetical protein